MKIKIISLTALLLVCGWGAQAQTLAVKTNLFYGAAAFTPNLGLEVGLGGRTSFDFAAGYNPWNREGSADDNKKMVHLMLQPELRIWTCERFNGHFFGFHGLFSQYNVGGVKLGHFLEDPVFEKGYRYEGYAYGGGFSYGYHWMLGKRFGLEFNIGVGVAHLSYDKFRCERCGELLAKENNTYVGLTKAGVTLVFLIK